MRSDVACEEQAAGHDGELRKWLPNLRDNGWAGERKEKAPNIAIKTKGKVITWRGKG